MDDVGLVPLCALQQVGQLEVVENAVDALVMDAENCGRFLIVTLGLGERVDDESSFCGLQNFGLRRSPVPGVKDFG